MRSRPYPRVVETVVARGAWLYDGVAPTAVLVVQLDYDFWYSVGEANGDLAADEAPALKRGRPPVLREAQAGMVGRRAVLAGRSGLRHGGAGQGGSGSITSWTCGVERLGAAPPRENRPTHRREPAFSTVREQAPSLRSGRCFGACVEEALMMLRRFNDWTRSPLGVSAMIMSYAVVAFVLCQVSYFQMDPAKNGSAVLVAGMLQIPIFALAAQSHGRARRSLAVPTATVNPPRESM